RCFHVNGVQTCGLPISPGVNPEALAGEAQGAALGERLLALVAGRRAPPPTSPRVEEAIFDEAGEVLTEADHAGRDLRHGAGFVVDRKAGWMGRRVMEGG